MKSLIVDFHGGAISDLAATLLHLGHSVEILDVNPQTKLLGVNGLQDLRVVGIRRLYMLTKLGSDVLFSRGKRKFIAASRRRRCFRKRWRLGRPTYDFAWVTFPPPLVRRVVNANLGIKTVLYLAHRADLNLRTVAERSDYWSWLVESASKKDLIILSSNRYDAAYLAYYSGIQVPVVEPWAAHMEAASTLETKTEAVLVAPKGLSRDWINLIRDATDRPLVPIEDLKSYKLSDLRSFRSVIFVPYSVYSITLLELLNLGVPVLIPTNKFLLGNNLLDDFRLYPKYASKNEVLPFENLHEKVGATSPNTQDEVGALGWLELSFWENHPNVYRWENESDLARLLERNLPAVEGSELQKNQRNTATSHLAEILDAHET